MFVFNPYFLLLIVTLMNSIAYIVLHIQNVMSFQISPHPQSSTQLRDLFQIIKHSAAAIRNID